MARYDGGFGGPRGAWRGRQGGPYRRGFREPGGTPDDFPQGGRPGPYGGEWQRQYGAGGYGGGGGWLGSRAGPGLGAGHRGDWRGRGGWDRGEYGGAYEEYGGYPGGPARGEYYGGRPSQGRGYDAGYAREPFMPEEAYRRHPEYRQDPARREWEAHQHEYGDELSDEEVREAVYRRMSADAWLDPERIDVQVEDGVVTLTGEVDDFLKARYAWDDAWETDGVRGVVNNLTVRADEPRAEPHGDVVAQSGGERTTVDEAEGMS
ncbi:MAG TPA: BON domain-containing protein [Longimicrobium sp.]